MTHRPAAPTKLQTDDRSAGDDDDSIEFAEFTGDDDVWEADEDTGSAENGTSSDKAEPPPWFKRRSEEPAEADSVWVEAPPIEKPGTEKPGAETAEQSAPRQRRRKKRGNKEGRTAESALIQASDDEPEQLDWRKDWKKIAMLWLISNATCGYGTSVIFHTILLGAMWATVYHINDDNVSISTTITEVDSMPIEFTEIMDLTVEPAGSSENQLPQLTKIPLSQAEAEISSSLLDSTASNAGNDGEGGDTDEGFGFMFSMQEGGKVVSKGSFSAWTVPEDPEPRKDYMIVIRIKLPEKTRLYRISDLSGTVQGSDDYSQYLPFDPEKPDYGARTERSGQIVKLRSSSRLRVIKNHVQVMIPVKGGDTLVRDTIHVRSRMLKEDQKLEIEF